MKLTRATDFVLRGSLSVENAIGSLLVSILPTTSFDPFDLI